jgi:HK97 gp10 family phage protein
VEIDSFEITGLDELEDQLLALSKKVATKSLRSALVRAARPVVKAAKAKVPVKTGALRQSIGTASRRGRGRKNFATAIVGPKSRNKRAIALANAGRSKPVKGIFWGHIVELGYGRQAPQPYLRPALDENADEAVQIFAKAIKQNLERVAANVNAIAEQAAL